MPRPVEESDHESLIMGYQSITDSQQRSEPTGLCGTIYD